MKKIVLTFGIISGLIMTAMLAVMIVLYQNDRFHYEYGEVFGYSSMVLAFLLVFFGIRSYRENVGGGTVTFGKAFQVGILITLITCAFYVVTWEIYYFNWGGDFLTKYTAHELDKMRAEGASAQQLEAERAKFAQLTEWYQNPLFNIGMTFMEIFPVGLVMTLVSAGILRRRRAAALA